MKLLSIYILIFSLAGCATHIQGPKDTPSRVVRHFNEQQFILANYSPLKVEIAEGHGKHLDEYAKLLKIAIKDRTAFLNEIRKNSDFLIKQEFPFMLYKELRGTLSKNNKFKHLKLSI